MLISFVGAYILLSVILGLWVARKVHNARDYAIAGRHLPLPVVIATVFATWFGAEAIFGVSATFVQDGLGGVVADPFGSSLCLILAGLFFATKLYRLNLLTLGDFYRLRYSKTVEILTTLCIVASYLGWVSAQIMALGLIIEILTHGALTQTQGMFLGAAIVLTYTTLGGMLSVAVLDFVQMAVIIGGLLYVGVRVSDLTGGTGPVIEHAAQNGKLQFFPTGGSKEWLAFIATGITMLLGSIPQQDVFQRITSAKSAKVALWGSILGALIYFSFTFVPMFIAYAATMIDPGVFGPMILEDSQKVLPTLILNHTPLLAQTLFFGAVLAAIMSCSSATLLAPSVTFTENVIKNMVPSMSDQGLLRAMRWTIVGFTGLVLVVATNSELSIFEMVESAYKVTLAGAFVPLIAGAYWKKASNMGALSALIVGLSAWLGAEYISGDEGFIPPQLWGLGGSILAMWLGSLIWPRSTEDIHNFEKKLKSAAE